MADELTHRVIIALDKTLEPGRAMNAIAHMMAGLSALIAEQGEVGNLRFQDYKDKSGQTYPSISDLPMIVMRGKKGEVRKFAQNARGEGMPTTCFLDTMIEGTYADQHERTNQRESEEINYFGTCVFGENNKLREFTKRLSLWQ